VSEISTRVWLDERLRGEVSNQAIAEGMTVRELIPRLVSRSLAPHPASQADRQVSLPTPAAVPASDESSTAQPGPPILALADVYRCGVCGAEIRLGGVSQLARPSARRAGRST
jgi:hypothetical protein